ncbi:hypothetical protein ACFVIM_12635 [Streptomyces sp. NPDC057638]|uniref:hypothetical protein n=1 Tax=Streptomyces sp. NPDC057638 TaxID=3346190 RepID=UPI0036AFDC5F
MKNLKITSDDRGEHLSSAQPQQTGTDSELLVRRAGDEESPLLRSLRARVREINAEHAHWRLTS